MKPVFSTTTVLGSFFLENKKKLVAIPQEEIKLADDVPKDKRKPSGQTEETW
jgi:hypothetical protein